MHLVNIDPADWKVAAGPRQIGPHARHQTPGSCPKTGGLVGTATPPRDLRDQFGIPPLQ